MESLDTRIWPRRLLQLARDISGPEGAQARGQFWLLLNVVLAQRLRMHSRRLGWIGNERIQDLASEKALDLVAKLDCGQWTPLLRTEGELVSFLSTVARNGVVDERRQEKRVEPDHSSCRSDTLCAHADNFNATDHAVHRKEFVSHLVACAGKLKPRDRVIWLLRVLHEMSSKSIAGHPEVLLNPGNVDVILDRCRARIRSCMRAGGLDASELPAGTFAELWKTFRAGPVQTETRND